jgi:hypothetical protein
MGRDGRLEANGSGGLDMYLEIRGGVFLGPNIVVIQLLGMIPIHNI